MAGTFDEYLKEQEDPLFTPVGGYEPGAMSFSEDPYAIAASVSAPDDYSSATEQLFTPFAASDLGLDKQGTFATPTFDMDYTDDPFSKLLNEQVKESSLISDSYSEKLAEISDRQNKLTNSAENDWSTLGAALVGGLGGLLAGGSASEIAGGAAAVGTTHYNNLEAQEKQKQVLLTQDASRLLTEQKIEQGRTGQLRNTQAQHAARMTMAQAQGKIVGTDENKQAQGQKEDLKKIGAEKPQNDAYAQSVEDTRMSKVAKTINGAPAGLKPLPGKNALNYADAKDTGTPISKVENGYQNYLTGLKMVQSVVAKGSQMTQEDLNVYRNGTASMADGRRAMAEVGQAITTSEWAYGIAPYLAQKGFDILSPTFDMKLALDSLVHDRSLPKMLEGFDKTMTASRARYYLNKDMLLPDFDYSTLSDTERRNQSAQELNYASQNGPNFDQAMQEWFKDTKLGQTSVIPSGPPGGVAPTPTVPPVPELTREQRVQAAYERQKAALEASKVK